MRMKKVLPAIPIILFCLVVFARPVPIMRYDKLTKEADLVVIATPISVRDIGEKTTLPGIEYRYSNEIAKPFPAFVVETTFTNLSVLKGDTNATTFIFHHFRAADGFGGGYAAPELVKFDPNQKHGYLMFLKREADGRYISMTGQADPVFAIKDLGDLWGQYP